TCAIPLLDLLTLESLRANVVRRPYPPPWIPYVCSFTRVHRGNPGRALGAADHVVEEAFETQQVHQSYLEPRASTADVEVRTGRVRVCTSTKSPFLTRNSLAAGLSVPVSQIQIFATDTGGGFGAKISSALDPCGAARFRAAG